MSEERLSYNETFLNFFRHFFLQKLCFIMSLNEMDSQKILAVLALFIGGVFHFLLFEKKRCESPKGDTQQSPSCSHLNSNIDSERRQDFK